LLRPKNLERYQPPVMVMDFGQTKQVNESIRSMKP
jgi:hypothetical protein